MSTEPTEVGLATIAHGAAVEMFGRELDRVLENIADPNTSAEVKREIKLTVRFNPTAERNMGGVIVSAEAKLAPMMSAESTIYIGRKGGRMAAIEHNPVQLQLEWDQERPEAPVVLEGGKTE